MFYARNPGIDILRESKWFLDSSKAGGGALIDIGCYDIDLALYLLGDLEPTSVSAMTFRGIESNCFESETKYDVEEHSVAFVGFKGGLKVSFETAWAANINSSQEAIILGSRGGLRLNPPINPFTYFSEEKGMGVSISYDFTVDRPPIQNLLIEDFVRACLEDKPPKTPGEDGLKVMQIIDMAYKSAELGREVRVNEII